MLRFWVLVVSSANRLQPQNRIGDELPVNRPEPKSAYIISMSTTEH